MANPIWGSDTPRTGGQGFQSPIGSTAENSPHLESRRPVRMMSPQSLQICAPENALARLRVVADGIVSINIVFGIGVSGC